MELKEIQKAVLAERERCAKIAEAHRGEDQERRVRKFNVRWWVEDKMARWNAARLADCFTGPAGAEEAGITVRFQRGNPPVDTRYEIHGWYCEPV